MAKKEKAGGGRAARLEARLGTLETSVQMLETAIRSEVERVHVDAEQMDSAVRALNERPDAVVDLSPILQHLDAIGHTIEGIAARPEAALDLTPVHEHLEALRADVAAANAGPAVDPEAALAPVRDRLDLVAAGVAELQTNRPDVTSSLQALGRLIDSMRESANDGQQRLELLSSRVEATASRLDDVLAGIALAVDQIESSAAAQREGIASVLAQIDTPPPSLPPPPPPGPAADLGGQLDALRAEGLAALRADIATSPPAPPPRPRPEEGNAAEAGPRLEERMDVEFDDVARQLDALGTLLQQTIEAIDRVESQITGAQPETDHMRSVARGTIETLRETSRRRIARRTAPPELNR